MKLPCRCISPQCAESKEAKDIFYVEEGEAFVCPRCGSDRESHITRLSIIHMLVPDTDGHYVGQDSNYSYGCQRAKDRAKAGNAPKYLTSVWEAATCADCREAHKPEDAGSTVDE